MSSPAIDPDWAADTCDHGSPVIKTTPSVFAWDGAAPIRDYADGCQGVGPYNDEGVSYYRKEHGL